MDNGRFLSDETKITVRMPEGIDARAYEFSQTSGLHHFFGEYTIHKYKYDQKTVQDLEKFIADFDGGNPFQCVWNIHLPDGTWVGSLLDRGQARARSRWTP